MPNEENVLFYKETGVMTLEPSNLSYDFFKEYLYVYSTLSSEITIYFNETPKRIYHTLKLCSEAQYEADHHCHKDSYHGYYDFRDIAQGCFKTICQVKGPKKDYTIVSQFHK